MPSRAALLLLVTFASACPSPAPELACAPGKVEACACARGGSGTQTCNADGTGYLECACTVETCAAAPGRCGAHGACQDSAMGPTCACATGYAGADCAGCAAGYQDNDRDGTCAPSCATAPGCGAHGRCADATGAAACACDEGYAGAACSTCASGYQDQDGDGTCKPTCATAMLGCGLGGTCVEDGGTPTCRCATNASGPTCASCAAGFQDNDQDNTCEPACGANSCSQHGTCSDTAGRVSCTCAAGYAGPSCGTCAAGFQDHDGNGSCAPTCAAAALSCGTGAACADGSGTAACACITGFTQGTLADGGSGCVFSGGFSDPGFQGAPANAWGAPDGGWLFASTAPGFASAWSDDAGIASVALSARGGPLTPLVQDFTLAGKALAAGLSFHALVTVTCGSPFPSDCSSLRPSASFNDTLQPLTAPYSPGPAGPRVLSSCLGDGALGPRTSFALWPPTSFGTGLGETLAIDRMWFELDPSCPAPGVIPNSDFSSPDLSGWTLSGSPGAGAWVAPAGINGSRALVLQAGTRCGAASGSSLASFPTALEHAALRFKSRGTLGRNLELRLNDILTTSFVTSAAPTVHTVCLPDTNRGQVFGFAFHETYAGSGACADVDPRFVEVDDVELVSAPEACPARLPAGEGGFEAGASTPGWFFAPQDCTGGACTGRSVLDFPINASLARTGSGSMRLSVGGRCIDSRVTTSAVVPPSSATGGPAIRFFYQLPRLAPDATMSIGTNDQVGTPIFEGLPVSSSWAPRIICLDPQLPGRPVGVTFLYFASGVCAETYAPDELFIDDFAVTTDPACPR